jgi:hypothetical protein
VANHDPAMLGLLEDAEEEINGVHIGCFTNVDHIFIFDECAEYFEEGGDIGQLGADVEQICVLEGGLSVLPGVLSNP